MVIGVERFDKAKTEEKTAAIQKVSWMHCTKVINTKGDLILFLSAGEKDISGIQMQFTSTFY